MNLSYFNLNISLYICIVFLRSLFYIFVVDINYVKNGVYELLDSTLEGKIVLGIYAKSKVLDDFRIKDMAILNEIQKDPINYKYVFDIFLK